MCRKGNFGGPRLLKAGMRLVVVLGVILLLCGVQADTVLGVTLDEGWHYKIKDGNPECVVTGYDDKFHAMEKANETKWSILKFDISDITSDDVANPTLEISEDGGDMGVPVGLYLLESASCDSDPRDAGGMIDMQPAASSIEFDLSSIPDVINTTFFSLSS